MRTSSRYNVLWTIKCANILSISLSVTLKDCYIVHTIKTKLKMQRRANMIFIFYLDSPNVSCSFFLVHRKTVCFPFSASHFHPQRLWTGVTCALMGESKLCLPVCHRQWITWNEGTTAARVWETLQHTCAHTSFSLRRRYLCIFFGDSHTKLHTLL